MTPADMTAQTGCRHLRSSALLQPTLQSGSQLSTFLVAHRLCYIAPGPCPSKSTQTGPCRLICLWMRTTAETEPHSRHVPADKMWTQISITPLCWRWRS